MNRVCEWCGDPLTLNQIVACSSSHRLKRWRWLNGIPVSPYAGVERPPEGSPLLDGLVASGGVQTADQGSRVSNGGLQVSFWKAVRALGDEPLWLPESIAVRVLTAALPVKQRERLAAAEKPLAGQLDLEGREAA